MELEQEEHPPPVALATALTMALALALAMAMILVMALALAPVLNNTTVWLELWQQDYSIYDTTTTRDMAVVLLDHLWHLHYYRAALLTPIKSRLVPNRAARAGSMPAL